MQSIFEGVSRSRKKNGNIIAGKRGTSEQVSGKICEIEKKLRDLDETVESIAKSLVGQKEVMIERGSMIKSQGK